MPRPIELGDRRFDGARAHIVGVLNVTPDSFSDGGLYHGVEAAVRRGRELAAEGADIIDVGGESTRPGDSAPVSAAAEIERVVPVVRALAGAGLLVSIDTTKAAVAAAALAAGAVMVNDIAGGLFDPAIAEVTDEAGAAYVLGHARGRDLAELHAGEASPPTYAEVVAELGQRLAALPAGLRARTIVDPGLGFGKGTAINVELGRRAGELGRSLDCMVMVGPSRKRFIGELCGGVPAIERDPGTVGAALAAVAGGAHFLRVHNVKLLRPALVVYECMRGPER